MTTPYTIEQRDNVLIITIVGPIDPGTQGRRLLAQARAVLDSSPAALHLMFDLRAIEIDLTTLIRGMPDLVQGDLALFAHPNLDAIAVVSELNLIQLAADAFGQQQYGEHSIHVFATVEEALAFLT